MFQKILVAIDHSDVSRHAFEQALNLAKTLNASLMLVYVLSPFNEDYPTPIYPGGDAVFPGLYTEAVKAFAEKWESYERQGLDMLRSLADVSTQAGVGTEFTQAIGDPGQAICTLAKTWQAELIIVGRRGRTGISEFFLGSISNYVVHHAPCSVLTVQ